MNASSRFAGEHVVESGKKESGEVERPGPYLSSMDEASDARATVPSLQSLRLHLVPSPVDACTTCLSLATRIATSTTVCSHIAGSMHGGGK